ncbi:YhgE/Pip domain-containing protein [Gehongia tenuis]|uniref:X-X-X-Leu-X-X-Gly heptad repeat-containing protein n=1 Tax=Gehongia tenuis TaxID=2763655 RepID=A0A926D5Q2_9FIRM|nr:hypothetical protein [Gehongia tenuis]MBC8532208.1 hypothetical protein [Gehongia tenuis]
MKKWMKWTATLSALLMGFVLTGTVQAAGEDAVTKDETIYVNLKNDGSVDQINAVQAFEAKNPGKYVDYGTYGEIKNLSDGTQPVVEDGTVIWDLSQGQDRFYYQGSLPNKVLPWEVKIAYTLDGESLSAEELAGASGKVGIHLEVIPREDAGEYFKSFMVQLSVPLKLDRVSAVDAPGATSAIAGGTQTLSYAVLAGGSGSFDITMDAHDFEMDAMQITAISSDMAASFDSDELVKNFNDLSGGLEEMISGTSQLRDGLSQLAGGISEAKSGLDRLESGTSGLKQGQNDFRQRLVDFIANIQKMNNGSQAVNDGLKALSDQGDTLLGGYRDLADGLSQASLDEAQLAQIQQLAGLAGSADPGEAQLGQLAQIILDQNGALGSAQSGLSDLNSGLGEYTGGVGQAAGQYQEFASGMDQLAQGAPALLDGFDRMRKGNEKVYSALGTLRDGLASLNSGAASLPDEVQKLIDGQKEMKDGVDEGTQTVDELLNGGNDVKPVSFVDERGRVSSVQFVMRTGSIQKAEAQVEPEEEEKAPTSFWGRLVDLFK